MLVTICVDAPLARLLRYEHIAKMVELSCESLHITSHISILVSLPACIARDARVVVLGVSERGGHLTPINHYKLPIKPYLQQRTR